MKRLQQLLAGIVLSGLGTVVHADYTLNMPVGVTELSRETYGLHMMVIYICAAIGLVVFGAMFYSIYAFRKEKHPVPATFHENSKIEILWTIIPFLILIAMVYPATDLTIKHYDTENAEMTIKITGYQWRWRYDYVDEGFGFMSSLKADSNAARQIDSGISPRKVHNYLQAVDHPLVIPVNTKIRFLMTSADVIHAWWVPEFGWKRDAIPGFITDAWASIDKVGIYHGACAELCGRDHGFMPIVVDVRSKEDYQAWLAEKKLILEQDNAQADRVWSKNELMVKGKDIYLSACAGCHQPNGEGIKGSFPAIKASPVATGDKDSHIELVLEGKGAMTGFAEALSPVELAAVITYQRNAFENNSGDLVQPAKIKEWLEDLGYDE
ncbi:MAG TPA: cytochrome c oxidase subunit II [Crenotrichaceae bacterium]|nr:cytochrome c oxidase subunit II [Crenotrichaceae bacterium]